jgi:hypothetical protein
MTAMATGTARRARALGLTPIESRHIFGELEDAANRQDGYELELVDVRSSLDDERHGQEDDRRLNLHKKRSRPHPTEREHGFLDQLVLPGVVEPMSVNDPAIHRITQRQNSAIGRQISFNRRMALLAKRQRR